ncbi:hypothetical protein OHA70_22420 [Kribbella sp. NBC_00382]
MYDATNINTTVMAEATSAGISTRIVVAMIHKTMVFTAPAAAP